MDKTGLVSFQGNKYSVPLSYQDGLVLVRTEAGRLVATDPHTGETVAEHCLSPQRGLIFKNSNHYRDHRRNVADREREVADLLGQELAERFCSLLRLSAPNIYKDQLAGLLKTLRPYAGRSDDWKTPLEPLSRRQNLTVSFVRDYLEAVFSTRAESPPAEPPPPRRPDAAVRAALAAYRHLDGQRRLS